MALIHETGGATVRPQARHTDLIHHLIRCRRAQEIQSNRSSLLLLPPEEQLRVGNTGIAEVSNYPTPLHNVSMAHVSLVMPSQVQIFATSVKGQTFAMKGFLGYDSAVGNFDEKKQ